MPTLSRREFVGALLSVPVVGLVLPKWLGDPAGGFYAPVPEDITPYLQWRHGIRLPQMAATIDHAVAYAAWAAPGETLANIQMFGGTTHVSDCEARRGRGDVMGAKRDTLARTMRQCMNEHHDPGWFKVTESVWGTGADGELDVVATRRVWKRVGYVRWLKPSDMQRAEFRVA